MAIEKPIFCLPLPLVAITTGNERAETPAEHLALYKSPGLRWRSDGNGSLWVRGQFTKSEAISMCSVLEANAQAGTTIRLRLGDSQAQVDGSAPYDSGAVTFIDPAVARESARYHSFQSFPEIDATWWRIDIGNHTGDFEAMKIVLGKQVQTSRFYDRGFEEGTSDLGSIDFARWGVAMETEGFVFRTKNFKLSWVSEAEFEASFRKIMMQGQRGPVFLLFDPAATTQRQEQFFFGRFSQPPFAQNSRKPGTFAMEFSMLSMLPDSVTIPVFVPSEGGDMDFSDPDQSGLLTLILEDD